MTDLPDSTRLEAGTHTKTQYRIRMRTLSDRLNDVPSGVYEDVFETENLEAYDRFIKKNLWRLISIDKRTVKVTVEPWACYHYHIGEEHDTNNE